MTFLLYKESKIWIIRACFEIHGGAMDRSGHQFSLSKDVSMKLTTLTEKIAAEIREKLGGYLFAMTPEDLRDLIAEELHKVLHPSSQGESPPNGSHQWN